MKIRLVLYFQYICLYKPRYFRSSVGECYHMFDKSYRSRN